METTTSYDLALKPRVKILAVDDREDNLLSIESILEGGEYEIVKALSGRAALKILLHQQDFTLILMDVQMPVMNGFETASLIYQSEKLKHIPIIFITAHNQGEERMFEGYKMGAVDFIYKPVNPELLKYKVSVFSELFHKTHHLISQEKVLRTANQKLESEIIERRISEDKVKLLNQQLTQNNEQLKSTIEELDRFAYVASHDLQEPLRKIQVFSDRLRIRHKDAINEEMENNLDRITNASQRMQELVNDLLNFSRHSSSEDDFAIVDLNIVVSDVLTDLGVSEENGDLVVEYDQLPLVFGIASQMRQLFQNLICNALKFRKKEESPAIRIFVSGESNNGDGGSGTAHYQIVVEDNGIGFDPKFANEIFVVFKRLHSYHEFSGSGVGLSICKKIVERHKGSIRAESEIGVGSKFIIELPVLQPQTPELNFETNSIFKS